MPGKQVLFGFLAGIGLTAAVVGGFWLAAPGGANVASNPAELEVAAVANGSLSTAPDEVRAVEETEAIVEDDTALENSPTTSATDRSATARPATARPAAAPSSPRGPAPAPSPAPPADPDPARLPAPPTPRVERIPAPLPDPSDVESPPHTADGDLGDGGSPQVDDWPSAPASAGDFGDDEPDFDQPVSGTVLNDPEGADSWEPPAPDFEDLVISADSVISLQVDTSLTTKTARIEDRVEARTIRDVQVDGDTAIPAGSLALASVTLVEPGGKIKERARLGIRFHTVVLADGAEVPIQTETIYRVGRPPSKSSGAKIGGAATAGAILGAIFGGRRGAVIGGAAGAAGGTAATMAGDPNPATISAGTSVTIRLQEPATVTIER